MNTAHGPFPEMENIAAFLAACRELGVAEHSLFDTKDLHDKRDLQTVVRCLNVLGATVQSTVPSFRGPYLGEYLGGGGGCCCVLVFLPFWLSSFFCRAEGGGVGWVCSTCIPEVDSIGTCSLVCPNGVCVCVITHLLLEHLFSFAYNRDVIHTNSSCIPPGLVCTTLTKTLGRQKIGGLFNDQCAGFAEPTR